LRDFFWRMSRWLVALAFTAVIIFLFYRFFPWHAFRFDQLDPRLPEAFHFNDSPWVFWGWVVALMAAAAFIAVRLYVYLCAHRTAQGLAGPGKAARQGWDDDGDRADDAISFPPGTEPDDPVYLFLSTSERSVAELFLAAGIVSNDNTVLTTQPQRAVLINAASSSLLCRGADVPGASPGLELLCRNLLAHDPEFPWLRGVFIVLPFDELGRLDPAHVARRVHADLQTIRRALQLDVPAYLVVSRMEQVPGFIEFARLRGPHEARQGRWGVSLPRRGADGDLAWRSLVDFRFRVRRRTIDLVVRDLLDHDRNARLQGLDRTLRFLIGPVSTVIAGGFPTAEKECPFLRAIDLVATGSKPDDQAYLLSSVYLPIFEDQAATRWTMGAISEDQSQRRRAARIAAGAGAFGLAVWLYIQFGLESLGWWGWAVFLALVAGWIATLIIMWRRWPGSPIAPAT
jgi:IcmF-related N-terminal domain